MWEGLSSWGWGESEGWHRRKPSMHGWIVSACAPRVCMHVCVYICVSKQLSLCVFLYWHISMPECISVCVCVCVREGGRERECVCVCVCVCAECLQELLSMYWKLELLGNSLEVQCLGLRISVPWLDLTPSQGTKIPQVESVGEKKIRCPNYILRQEKTCQFFFPIVKYNIT